MQFQAVAQPPVTGRQAVANPADEIITVGQINMLDKSGLKSLQLSNRKMLYETIDKINLMKNYAEQIDNNQIISRKEQNTVITATKYHLTAKPSQTQINPVVKKLMFDLLTLLDERLHTQTNAIILDIMSSVASVFNVLDDNLLDVNATVLLEKLAPAFSVLFNSVRQSPLANIINEVKVNFVNQFVTNAKPLKCPCGWKKKDGSACTTKTGQQMTTWIVPADFNMFEINNVTVMRCGTHMPYEFFDVDDSALCGGCKNYCIKYFLNSQCITCLLISEKNRNDGRANVIKCSYIFNNGTPCPSKQTEGHEYCKLHIDIGQRKKHYDEVVANGGLICSNYVKRICGGEGANMEEGFAQCIKCRRANH
jgi:hypothetical protein